MEVWKECNKVPRFEVSNLGRLRNKNTKKILSQRLHPNGYYMHATRIGGRKGKALCLRVHRLVAEAFVDNPENKPIVNHIDGNKVNNEASNLEWCTYKENSEHAYRTGLVKPPMNEDRRALSDTDVNEILDTYIPYDKEFGARALGRRYDVCHTTILKVVKDSGYKAREP